MSERKVLNKYYPPDFDPSKIPRMKLPKNRQYTVRLMAPFNMRCATCGEYIYKGKKFNARKEDVENQEYLGIRIYRFYIKCTRCLQEISFKTDPRNTDYEIEAGATRNFMALKLAEEQALREEEEAKEEEANNPMMLLENRTKQSKNEIELLESLEELKDLNKRQQVIDYDTMLAGYDDSISVREREKKLQQLDEEYIKTIKFQSTNKRKLIVEEEILDIESGDTDCETVEAKTSHPSTLDVPKPQTSRSMPDVSWGKDNKNNNGNAGMKKHKALSGLVRPKSNNKSDEKLKDIPATNEVVVDKPAENDKNQPSSSLSLLGAYSDSDGTNSD